MEWIGVEDRLPPEGQICLLYITYPKGTMFNCRCDPLPRDSTRIGGLRYDKKFISYEDQYSDHGLKHVSHWQPVPPPPKDSQ